MNEATAMSATDDEIMAAYDASKYLPTAVESDATPAPMDVIEETDLPAGTGLLCGIGDYRILPASGLGKTYLWLLDNAAYHCCGSLCMLSCGPGGYVGGQLPI